MTKRDSLLLILTLFILSSDALPINVTSQGDLTGLCGVLDAKEKLFKLGITSDYSSSRGSVLTTWADMNVAGLTKRVCQDGYQKEFGVRPNDIHLNDGFAHQWGWYSYNHLGDVRLTNIRIEPKTSVNNDRLLINGDNQNATHKINLKTTMSNSATSTVTSKSDISTTGTITVGSEELGLGAEFSSTLSLSNEVGSSDTKSTEVSVGDLVIVSLPPRTKTRVYLNVTWTSKTADWAIPVTIDPNGYTGVDFGRKVRDHYYWGSPHALLADPPFQSMMRGRLDASFDTKGVVVIEEPTPL